MTNGKWKMENPSAFRLPPSVVCLQPSAFLLIGGRGDHLAANQVVDRSIFITQSDQDLPRMLANRRRELRLLLHNAFYVDRIVDRGHGAQCRMIKLGENSVCFHLWVLSYAVNGWDWTPYYVVLVEQNLPLRHILRRERFIEQRNYLLSVLEPRFGGNITRVVDQVAALD